MRICTAIVSLFASSVVAATAHATADCRAETTGKTNVLVELFTSEGCNSCPPADRWLSALGRSPAVPAQVVPIAWHVDYWDYIGWKDRFAQAAFSARQRLLAEARREPVVYTPQVLVQGRDFRRWSRGDFDAVAADIQTRPARARLALSVIARSDSSIEVEVSAALLDAALKSDPAAYGLIIATTASGLSTEVAAGENAGVRLTHDHVAMDWRGPMSLAPKGVLRQRHRLALPSAAPGRAGVVVFVQNMRSADVLQALMLPACPG